MMTKMSALLLVLATGCHIFFPVSEPAPRTPRSAAFESGEQCPNVCWLGIRPGVTVVDEALGILGSSKEIDRERLFEATEYEIRTVWKSDVSNTYGAHVRLLADGTVIQPIIFRELAPFTLKDLVAHLGEPDRIRVKVDPTVDGGDILGYVVHFSKHAASIYVYPGSKTGPSPDDTINTLVLNAAFTYPEYYQDIREQDWLGYGHLEQYLGQKPSD